MGAALSVNIANEMVNAMVSDNNSAKDNCSIDTSQIQSQNINGLNGGTFINNWNEYAITDAQCVQSDNFSNSVSQSTLLKAEQLAKSISQQFQLSSSAAFNLTNLAANLAVTVSNSFTQDCYANTTQQQLQTVNNTNGGGTTGGITGGFVYNNWNEYSQSALDCISKDQAVNNIQQQIQLAVQQSASATVENTLAQILGIIFAIFAVIGIIYFISMYYKKPQQQQSSSDIDTEIASLITAEKLSTPPPK